ncbi:hypothetical protein GCM10022198_08150 [Klugiella xanthotipulae]|uniref:ATP-binding cassette subfamily C protein CydD n=1 Tax=Klugiella xanthotipulae TaxID=244735 RepID=A0A543HSW3_9MICO|nr:thiol reductant ABC exporter subunit CydD [Klugiella xanthotipulae]TQM61425.1 ATP-binding cassette subfamily C protein CydD [Klugiella xanthotipulae]
MKPFDARLLRYAQSIRGFLVRGALLGLLRILSLVGVAWYASQAIVAVVEGDLGRSFAVSLCGLTLSVFVRAVTIWLVEANSARGASAVKSELRQASLGAIDRLGPSWLSGRSSATITTSVTQGLDALDEYFAKYIPQLILTVLATPFLLILIWRSDALSALIIIGVYPVIPIFMVLIGWATQSVQRKQWDALNTLARSFHDVVGGLSTLKIFGRAERQSARIQLVTEDYRVRTMKVLRVTFLSGFVLDLAGTISVAFVAVGIGVRLIEGSMPLAVGLFVLLLTPEVFVPIRQVGASFHAAAEGLTAVEDVFDILDEDRARSASLTPGAVETTASEILGVSAALELRSVSIRYDTLIAVNEVSLTLAPGLVTALVGPSGAGKSSLLGAITGLVPHGGRVCVAGQDVTTQPPGQRGWLSWVGQRPGLVAGTVASNVSLGSTDADSAHVREAVAAALTAAAGSDIDPLLELGPAGEGLSGGQAQRVSIARALFRLREKGASVLILDEPTSALDSVTEGAVLDTLRKVADSGIAVLVVSHRHAVAARADTILRIGDNVSLS